MCLIVVGWQAHPAFPLVVAANRDEFYARPSAPAAYWSDAPEIIAGRDLEASGTWLGVTRQGRFAAVTNVREPGVAPGRLSRGELTRNFLQGGQSASDTDWIHLPDPVADALTAMSDRVRALESELAQLRGEQTPESKVTPLRRGQGHDPAGG